MAINTTIIVPAFNEADRLAAGYERLAPVLARLGVPECEVIVVDDGSSDDTLRRAGEIYGHLPHNFFVQQPENRGKGAAVRLGISLARGAKVIVADADMSIDPEAMIAMVDVLDHADLAPGTRAPRGVIRYESPLRTVAGGVFNRVVRHYTGSTLRDTQCGLKGFNTGVARLLGSLGFIDRFAYDAEMLYLAAQLGLRVEAVPVTWHEVAGSKVRLGRDSRSMVHDIRGLKKTRYENPVVVLPPGANAEEVANFGREARVQGLVIARGLDNDLVVLPRDGALGGLGISAALGGQLRTATLDELRNRRYDAV